MSLAAASATASSPDDTPAGWLELENGVLGAVLRDGTILTRLEGIVGAEDFSRPIGQRVFDAVEQRFRSGCPASPDDIAGELGDYEWDVPGGADRFLAELLSLPPPAMPIESADRLIARASLRRHERSTLYHRDVAAWAHAQSRLLTELAGRGDLPREIDWPNIIEEVLSVGRSEISGVARRAELVFVHPMKAASSPDTWSSRKWRSEIALHLGGFQGGFAPSMRSSLNTDRLWTAAAREAAQSLAEYGERPARAFPTTCPFTLDHLLAAREPDELVERLARAISERDQP